MKRFLIYALITLMVMSAYQPIIPSYAVENVTFEISPLYINSDLLPTVVTVTADKNAFTVGSVYPTLIDGSNNSQSVSIVDSSATELKFTVPAGVSDGTYQIRISDPEGDQGTTTKYYIASSSYGIDASSVTTTTPFDSLPKGYDEQQSITVTGDYSSFALGQTTVELLQSSSVIDSASVTAVADVTNTTTQTMDFTVNTGLASGTYDVRFTTGDDVDTVSGGLVVRDTASIALDDNDLTEGYAQTNVTVTGTNTGFDGSTQVQILDDQDAATGKAGSANITDEDTLGFSILTGLTAGSYTVKITTGVEEATAALTIYEPSAELRKQSDNTATSSIGQYYGAQNLKLIGTNTNFDSGTTSVAVFKGGSQVSGAISGTPTVNSTTEVLFTLAEWTSTIGTGDLSIVATTGDETVTATLAVVEPALALTYNSSAVESNIIANGYKEFTIDIVGTDTFFANTSTVDVTESATNYAKDESFTDVENLGFTLEVGLSEGTHDLNVDLDGSGSGTNTVSTTVTVGPAASISSVSPSNILRTINTAKTYTVYGTNTHFEAGTPSVDILGTATEDVSNISVVDATTFTFDLIPSSVDTNGDLDVEVTVNSLTIGETATKTGAVTASNQGVEASPETYYTLDKGNATVTISAEGFTYDTSVSNITASIGGISTSVTRNSDTEIEVTLPSGVTEGAQEVLVNNNGTEFTTGVSVVTSQESNNNPAFKIFGYTSSSDNNIVVQGNTTLTFNSLYEPTITASRNATPYTLGFVSIDNAANTLTMSLPDDLSAGYYDISIQWASGPYSGNSLSLTNYEVKNEVDAIEIYYSGTLASDRTVYLNGSGTVDFTAIGNIINGSESSDKTSTATWTSSDTSVATMSGGTATVLSQGNTDLTVAYDDVSDTITLYVNGPDTISITGSDVNIRIGESVTLAAEGIYGDSSTETLTSKSQWSASNSNVSISSNVVTGKDSGQSVVSAMYGGTTGTLDLTVSSIDFTPSSVRTLELGNREVIVNGIESGTAITGLTVDGQTVTPTGTSFIPPSGISTGNVTVALSASGNSHSATLTVAESSMVLGNQLVAAGYDAFDMVVTLKNADLLDAEKPVVRFNGSVVSESSVVVDEAKDTVTFPVAAGNASGDYDVVLQWLTGGYAGNSLTETLSIASEITYSISGTSSVAIGSSTNLTLVADVDGTDQNITSGIDWSSSNASIATVNSSGAVTGIGSGSATITATFQGEDYTKVIVVPDSNTGGSSGGSGGGSGGGTGGSTPATDTGPILTPDDTKSVVDDILDNAATLDVKDVIKDLSVITDSSIVTIKGGEVVLEEALDLADKVFLINETLLGRSESTATELSQAASDMTQVVGAFVSRDDVTAGEAVEWADKVLEQIGAETLEVGNQSAKEASQVATDVIDNVIVSVLEKGLDEETATDVFETFIEDVAKKAMRLDTEKVDSAKLVDRIVKASTDIVEIAGRVDASNLVQSQEGTTTVVTVGENALILAANNAIQKSEELRILVALNTSTDIKELLSPRLGLVLPQTQGDVNLELDKEAVAGVENTGAEIQVSAKGTTFVFSNETLKEMKETGINLQVGEVGSLEQTLYLRDMDIGFRSNIAKIDNSKQISVQGYDALQTKPTLSMAFDDTVIFVPEFVNVFVYDEDAADWEFVRSDVDQARGEVNFKPPHFSIYSVVEYSKTFDDVKDHWSKVFVDTMASRGMTSGISETMFGPDYSITRAQFATLLTNALGLEGSAESVFRDVNAGTWYYSSVNLAAEAGLVSGMGNGLFEPDARITREQMAVMISKAYEIMLGSQMVGREASITDISSVSSWATDAVKAVNYHGVVSGFEDGSFKPNEFATRAHGIVMLKKLLDLK